jgi:hypothetical protein
VDDFELDRQDGDIKVPAVGALGGLLDPATFTSGQEGATTGSAWYGEGASPMPRVQGGLLDPWTFPVNSQHGDEGSGPDLKLPSPQVSGQLDPNPHAEALNGVQGSAPDDVMVINGQRYRVISAKTFNPALSNGKTIMPSPDVMTAASRGASTVGVVKGDDENGGYIAKFAQEPTAADVDPKTGLAALRFAPMVFRPSAGLKPSATDTAHLLHMLMPSNAEAGIHGHIDSEPSGFVDSTLDNHGYGDTQSLTLQNAVPMATVSHGQVGWHVLDDGQLKFIYPEGAMSEDQIHLIQYNLNNEQKLFHIGK